MFSENSTEIEWAKLCLERCKGCPVDINMYWEEEQSGLLDDEKIHEVLHEVFLPYTHQWREICINVETYLPIRSFLVHLALTESSLKDWDGAPNLEILELSNREEEYESKEEDHALLL